MRSRPSQVGVPDTHEFAAKGAPARSAAFVAGKGISSGYACGVNINSKPSGGGRADGGTRKMVVHPRSKKGAY